MITITLMRDNNPVEKWIYEDEDLDLANKRIDEYRGVGGALWLDVVLEEDEDNPGTEEHLRICDVCGHIMCEGFYDEGKYYCSSDCLSVDYPTVEDWEERCKNNDESYWTIWWE